MKGISVFDREIKIAQLADDTMLFLEDKNQLLKALEMVEQFSCASGLKLNGFKCEFMSIHDMDDIFLGGIPVKKSVKYLGIHITKNAISRHHLNFSDKIKKRNRSLTSGFRKIFHYMVEFSYLRLKGSLVLYICLFLCLSTIKFMLFA